jgi:hypothetical protein
MKILTFLSLVFLFMYFGCKETNVLDPQDQISLIVADINGLQALGDSAWYELWLVWQDGSEEKNQTIGVFSVDEQGNLSRTTFDISAGYVQSGQKVFLTVEEDDVPGMRFEFSTVGDSTVIDTIFEPSSYKIMAATIAGNIGNLSVGHEDLNDFDYQLGSGKYMLDTPTDNYGSNPESGIWFVSKDTADQIAAGLDLAVAAGGWRYEGLVNLDGNILSTGKFRSPKSPDESNQYSDSTGAAYPFPGEDFLINAPESVSFPTNLKGKNVVIQLHPPYPARSEEPFTAIPLSVAIPNDAQVGTILDFQNTADSFPSGTVYIEIKIYK